MYILTKEDWETWALEEIQYAIREEDSHLKKSLKELVKVFARQKHNYFLDLATIYLFYRLTKFKPLTPITNNPIEWQKQGEVYRSKRCPSVFTTARLLKQNKAYDKDYYYKIKNKIAYHDDECSKIVELPYFPPVESIFLQEKQDPHDPPEERKLNSEWQEG